MKTRDIPAVAGGAELVAKMSAVDKQGEIRNRPIEGVSFRPTRPVAHEDGHVAEVARTDWPVGGPIAFAGEACSDTDYATVHGAWESGIAAVEQLFGKADR